MAIAKPEFLQTQQYPAKEFREMFLDVPLQEGVFDPLDLKVVQRGAGANMSVDVAAGAAWVKGDTISRQGMYHMYSDAVANIVVASNSSGNPRIDQIVARVYDSTDGAAAQDNGAVEMLQGTASAGATLTNRTGAAALPATAIRLADILVANGAASITSANIRDRRPWSRGAGVQVVRRANAAAGSDYATSSTSYVVVDGTNLNPRLECSGVPVRLRLDYVHFLNGAASGIVDIRMDGTTIDGGIERGRDFSSTEITIGRPASVEYIFTPSAGSHQFAPYYKTTAGTYSLIARAATPLMFTVEELLRTNIDNGTV
jgi:hypothetical protein